jgi:chorismate dehydratase
VQDRPSLRIGCVKYLNARPLVHGLPGNIVLDHPSALCAQLARGELDVALVSSFEFLRNPIYKIVDDVAIASDGAVYSVVVAHEGRISEVQEIELDPAAETSGNLLRCLLGEMNLRARVVPRSTMEPAGAERHGRESPRGFSRSETRKSSSKESARLLIGDQAIRFRQDHVDGFQYFDLGENWKNVTGLPFVYALWLVRPEVVDPKPIADQLRALRDKNLANLNQLVSSESEFDRAFCDRYFHEHLRFNFGEREKQGLRKFSELCQKHELLPKREIAFSVV